MSAHTPDRLATVRVVADAVLYEGYLLYPYRASSRKNQSRWQFGVLGPPTASADSFGEDPDMAMECLLALEDQPATVTLHLRFLQLQAREAQRLDTDGAYVRVDELPVDEGSVLSWDEAVEHEIALPAQDLLEPLDAVVEVGGGRDVEPVADAAGGPAGRIVRRRWPLVARVRTDPTVDCGFVRLRVSVQNEHPDAAPDKEAAIRTSLIGAHVLMHAHGARFLSLLDPPEAALAAASRCQQRRCWPVLAGSPGTSDVVLGAPIILYDYPEVAEQSAGALFDSTEIDEILTLRVMTMTDDEKAQARATDPRAAAIIDRCDEMSEVDLQRLHGVRRDPREMDTAPGDHAYVDRRDLGDLRNVDSVSFETGDVPWWDPEGDASVNPDLDSVVINGIRVGKDSLVRVHPSRRADAQDLFFVDQVARVRGVLADVDGGVHVAVVLADDPAADLHEWYGRYLYFAPDELEPLDHEAAAEPHHYRQESRS